MSYYPVFCAKSASYTQTQETIEVTSVNSGNDREYEPGMSTHALDISGITLLDNTENRISILYLMQLAQRRAVQSMKITLTDDDGTAKVITFSAIIVSNNFTKDLGGSYSQSSTSFVVTGGVTISDPVDPPGVAEVQAPLYIDCVAGETSVHHDLLEQAGVEILHVHRAPDGLIEVAGTPGAGTLEFMADLPNGDIYTDPSNPYNDGEVIYVLYQIQA